MAEASGLAKVVADAAAVAEPDAPLRQLPLLPAEAIEALPEDQAKRSEALRAPRAGRPVGALNKRTIAWRDYLLSRYQSPLVGLAEIAARSARDLAAELGCTPLEAFKEQVKALGELAPYLHARMPVEVNVGGALPVLHLVAPEASAEAFRRGPLGGVTLDLTALAEIEQNQGLGDAPAAQSNGQQSNGAAKTAESRQSGPVLPQIGDQMP